MKYDVLITVAEKDFNKLRFVYDSIVNNLDGVRRVYVISNVKIPQNKTISGIKYFLDSQVLDLDFSRFTGKIKEREGWYKQQFIKLLQEVTRDNYLVVDADVVLNRKVQVIINGKPVFLLGRNQHNKPYFDLMKTVFDLDKVYQHSFINEIMFFKRDIIKHLLSYMGVNKYGFFELVLNQLNKADQISGFSEYELYGNYVTKYFPNEYSYKHMRTYPNGKDREWTEYEIQKYIDSFKGLDYDILSIHSWV